MQAVALAGTEQQWRPSGCAELAAVLAVLGGVEWSVLHSAKRMAFVVLFSQMLSQLRLCSEVFNSVMGVQLELSSSVEAATGKSHVLSPDGALGSGRSDVPCS